MSLESVSGARRRRWRIVWTGAAAAWVVFIFLNSLLPGPASSATSGFVLRVLQSVLDFFRLPVTVSELFVRKAAHFLEYAVLGILLAVTMRRYSRRLRPLLPLALLIGLAVPVADESLQLLIPGRAGMVADILLDFGGVATGLLPALFILSRRAGKDEAA